MALYIAGLVLFFGTHLFSAIRPRAPGRNIRQKMGEGPYMLVYSLVALAGFVLIVMGYTRTGPAPVLYDAPIWGRHLNYILMPLALIILASAYMPTGYIKKTLKHPMLVAIKVWAVGHLLANGELNAVILFTAFLAYAVIDRIAVKRRGDVGPGPDAAVNPLGDVLAIVIGLGVSAALIFYLHEVLFGRAVWPPMP